MVDIFVKNRVITVLRECGLKIILNKNCPRNEAKGSIRCSFELHLTICSNVDNFDPRINKILRKKLEKAWQTALVMLLKDKSSELANSVYFNLTSPTDLEDKL